MLRCGLDLLTAVAEEAGTQLGGKPRQDACVVLTDQADDVLTTLGVALSKALGAAGACMRMTETFLLDSIPRNAVSAVRSTAGGAQAGQTLFPMHASHAGLQAARRLPCRR
jgi:hypothetical protein